MTAPVFTQGGNVAFSVQKEGSPLSPKSVLTPPTNVGSPLQGRVQNRPVIGTPIPHQGNGPIPVQTQVGPPPVVFGTPLQQSVHTVHSVQTKQAPTVTPIRADSCSTNWFIGLVVAVIAIAIVILLPLGL